MNRTKSNHSEKLSLHEQVARRIRQDVLRSLHPGVKLESETRLAKRLGVSVNTLRQALSILAHEGLIARHQGSGTFVARPRHHQAVAVATSTYRGQPPQSFQMRLFLSVAELLRHRGYRCRSYIAPMEVTHAWDELIEDVSGGRIAGAVFMAMNANTVPIPLAEHHVPFLQWDGAPGSVILDFADLVRQGVTQLLAGGCRRIALMQWMGDEPDQRATAEAFRSVLASHGLPVREEWVRPLVAPDVPGAGWEQFREVWSARAEKPDGLLVTDDVLFRDVALAILDSRIDVPNQLQVVTHANKGSGLTYPFPVSLLEVDLDEWAEAMVDRLIKLMNHETVRPSVQPIRARLIPPEFTRIAPNLNVEITK